MFKSWDQLILILFLGNQAEYELNPAFDVTNQNPQTEIKEGSVYSWDVSTGSLTSRVAKVEIIATGEDGLKIDELYIDYDRMYASQTETGDDDENPFWLDDPCNMNKKKTE